MDKKYLLTYKLYINERNFKEEYQWFNTKEEMNEFITEKGKDIVVYEKMYIPHVEYIED